MVANTSLNTLSNVYEHQVVLVDWKPEATIMPLEI
jgi:hypothetical protein